MPEGDSKLPTDAEENEAFRLREIGDPENPWPDDPNPGGTPGGDITDISEGEIEDPWAGKEDPDDPYGTGDGGDDGDDGKEDPDNPYGGDDGGDDDGGDDSGGDGDSEAPFDPDGGGGGSDDGGVSIPDMDPVTALIGALKVKSVISVLADPERQHGGHGASDSGDTSPGGGDDGPAPWWLSVGEDNSSDPVANTVSFDPGFIDPTPYDGFARTGLAAEIDGMGGGSAEGPLVSPGRAGGTGAATDDSSMSGVDLTAGPEVAGGVVVGAGPGGDGGDFVDFSSARMRGVVVGAGSGGGSTGGFAGGGVRHLSGGMGLGAARVARLAGMSGGRLGGRG